ncbi:MAG: hypothetical protein R2733_00385 [Acidimicrobiales bacterium]
MKDARPSIPGIDLGELCRTAGRLETYDAKVRSTGQPVVVSFIAPGDDDYLELVIAHQRAIQDLAPAGIQRVLDAGIEAGGQGYVVAEVVEGQLLSELEHGGSMDRLSGIADAVSVLHEHQLAHGALSPDNIVVQPDGTLKLLNAGLAGYVDDSASIFQPDEQAQRPRPVVADDVFSLGALGWWLQTGLTPDKPGALGAPEHVEAALRRALDLDPGERQWTVREFLYELEHTVDAERSFIPSDVGSELPPAGLGPRKLPILVGAGLVALLFAAFTVFRPSDPDISTEVLGINTVPTTEETTTTTAPTAPTTTMASSEGDNTDSSAEAETTGSTAPAPAVTSPQTNTTRRPATTATRPPATTATTAAPTTTTTQPQTIPSLSLPKPGSPLNPTTTTTRPTTTTTREIPTTTEEPTTTAAPTTTEAPTTTAKPTTTTTKPTTTTPPTTKPTVTTIIITVPNPGSLVTRNPVLPDTPVTGTNGSATSGG